MIVIEANFSNVVYTDWEGFKVEEPMLTIMRTVDKSQHIFTSLIRDHAIACLTCVLEHSLISAPLMAWDIEEEHQRNHFLCSYTHGFLAKPHEEAT